MRQSTTMPTAMVRFNVLDTRWQGHHHESVYHNRLGMKFLLSRATHRQMLHLHVREVALTHSREVLFQHCLRAPACACVSPSNSNRKRGSTDCIRPPATLPGLQTSSRLPRHTIVSSASICARAPFRWPHLRSAQQTPRPTRPAPTLPLAPEAPTVSLSSVCCWTQAAAPPTKEISS